MEQEVDRSAADPPAYSDAAVLADLISGWTAGPGVIYRRLADAVAQLIETGDLPAGARLPAERGLAEALAVSRSTVVAAYDDLRGRGLVESRRGSGTRVRAQIGRPRTDRRITGGSGESMFAQLTTASDELISMAFAVDAGAPELAQALQELVDTDLPHLLRDIGYHPRGISALRTAIATHLSEEGMPTTPDQVVVTTGAHQGIALATQMYLRRGDTVVVESPSWPGSFDLFAAAGARVVGVPLDVDGIRIDGLAAAIAEDRPALVLVMPTFHNPTGRLMSATRRRRLAELAAETDTVVVEDNAYSSVLSDGAVPMPLAAYAPADAEVLSIGSLSKAVWGGLRIGWIRAPAPVAERLARHKALVDLGSPVLDQALATRLLPRLPELAATRSATARRRLGHLSGLLRERLPQWRWEQPTGGSALWIALPDTDAQVFSQVARRHGVELVAGRSTDPSGAHDAYIRLPFTYPIDLLTEVVDRLVRAWSELRRHGAPPSDAAGPVV
jgi:DNA-binding transcriptional MocR family regulator